jgi:hypothetical protein
MAQRWTAVWLAQARWHHNVAMPSRPVAVLLPEEYSGAFFLPGNTAAGFD